MRTTYPGFTDVGQADLIRRADVWSKRFVALARQVDPALQVTGEWTAREVVAHVVTVLRRYTERDVLSREGLSDDFAALHDQNRDEVTALGDRPMDALLADLEAEVVKVLDRYSAPLDIASPIFPFHGGVTIDGAAGLANLSGEFMFHGRDIALAADRHWRLEDDDLRPLLNLVLQTLEALVVPGAAEVTVEFQVPGVDRFLVQVTDQGGAACKARPSDRPDVRVRVPAATLVLLLYQRIGNTEALRGGMRFAGGRRPWRIRRLQHAFVTV